MDFLSVGEPLSYSGLGGSNLRPSPRALAQPITSGRGTCLVSGPEPQHFISEKCVSTCSAHTVIHIRVCVCWGEGYSSPSRLLQYHSVPPQRRQDSPPGILFGGRVAAVTWSEKATDLEGQPDVQNLQLLLEGRGTNTQPQGVLQPCTKHILTAFCLHRPSSERPTMHSTHSCLPLHRGSTGKCSQNLPQRTWGRGACKCTT